MSSPNNQEWCLNSCKNAVVTFEVRRNKATIQEPDCQASSLHREFQADAPEFHDVRAIKVSLTFQVSRPVTIVSNRICVSRLASRDSRRVSMRFNSLETESSKTFTTSVKTRATRRGREFQDCRQRRVSRPVSRVSRRVSRVSRHVSRVSRPRGSARVSRRISRGVRLLHEWQ